MNRLFSMLLAAILMTGCVSSFPSPVLASPDYPKMAAYPNEPDFLNPVTGEFDSDGFHLAYQDWHDDQNRQHAPQGYADGLHSFWSAAIPAFLDSGAENPVCSPLNLYLSLALLAEVTTGTSRAEILSLLNNDSLDGLRLQASQVWNAHYCADGASACILANSLWLDEGLTYARDTVSRLTEHYYASVFQGDLGSKEMDAQLQQWLTEQTHGLLAEQASQLHMNPQTVLALASTIYYRARWHSSFDSTRNTWELFQGASGDQTAEFMGKTLNHGPYYWTEDCGAVTLHLEDGSNLWLILPDEGFTPKDLLDSGHAMDMVLTGNSFENQKSLKVHLRLPKFDIAANGRMDDVLQRLGVTAVFSPDAADFTPILPQQAAWLDAVNHTARVKIDEEGVEAAAYTVMMAPGSAMPPEEEMEFILNRPFLFVITSRDGLPLFAGAVNTIE